MNGPLQDLFKELVVHWPGLSAFLAVWVAIATFVWRLRNQKIESVKWCARLESRVAENERRLEQHLADVAPLWQQFNKSLSEQAAAKEKISSLDADLRQLVRKIDRLIETILEWRKNGGR